jgi:hypothetical protein
MAARVLNDNLGRGLARMGEAHTKGLGYLADATDAPSLTTAYKEARVAIEHQALVEKGVVSSASILWTNTDLGKQRTAAFSPLIDQRAAALLNEVTAAYQVQAQQRGGSAPRPADLSVMTAEEKAAANLVVESVAGAGRGGGRGGGGGAGGGNAGPSIPQEMNAELSILIGQHKTVLEIRDFLAGEFTPLPLADLMAVLRAREASGQIRLVPKS